MSDYSRPERALQVVISGKMYADAATGEAVEALNDDKFSWREKKQRTLRLADVYQAAQMADKADKVKSCSTWLEYLASASLDKRQLLHVNLCHQRLCPLCAARRAKQMARRLMRILARVEADHPGVQFIFLTLTIENVTGDKLREALDLLTRAWNKLTKRRPFVRAIKGWFRALEITRNRVQDTYHPHIHGVLAVEPEYFKRSGGLYLTHDAWVTMWQQSLQVSYRPTVRIQRTRGKAGRGGAGEAAAVEAAKYATKDADYISPALPSAEAAKVAAVYTAALARKRMTALGGWLLEASQALKVDVEAEGDLIHDDDSSGDLTQSTAELLEAWGWHYGVSDHVLKNRRPNPDYVPGAAADEAEEEAGQG